MTAVVRSSAVFRCKTDNTLPIRWNRIDPYQLLPVVIYNGYTLTNKLKYAVRAELGQLEVKDVAFLDAGTYECHELNSSVNHALFHLSITGKLNSGIHSDLIKTGGLMACA